jgi:hypothetical protein
VIDQHVILSNFARLTYRCLNAVRNVEIPHMATIAEGLVDTTTWPEEPLLAAIREHRPLEVVQALIDALDVRTTQPVQLAAALPATDAVLVALLDAGFPVCGDAAARDPVHNADDPLHAAARANNARALVTLLQRGAPINALNSHGDTPLAVAAGAKAAEAATVLIEAGADVNDYGEACSAGSVWATLAAHGLWAPLIASWRSPTPPTSVGTQFMVVRELIESKAPLEVVRSAIDSGLYAEEITRPYDGAANMSAYARARGLDAVADLLAAAAAV